MVEALKYRIGPVNYVVTENLYIVEEPKLTDEEEHVVEVIKDYMVNRDIEPTPDNITAIASKLGFLDTVKSSWDKIYYHLSKRLSPWKFLYPIIIDRRLEDVSVTSSGIWVRHREMVVKEYLQVRGIKVPPPRELREYAQSLAAHFGASVSPAFPIVEFDASGMRVTIVLDVIASSTTISVRIHPEHPLTLDDLIANKTLTREAAEYLLEVLRSRGAIFVVGYQGSGKTTLVNALLDELPEDWKIVVIEDVPEIRLVKHEHWVSLRVRRARSLAAARETEVTYRDLIRTALRLGGQVTTMTEARGEEVKELLEVAALGEAVIATFHARDWQELRQRLELLGVSREYLSLLWAVVIMGKVRLKDGRVVRRVLSIREILPDASENLLFVYDPDIDRLRRVGTPRRLRT